MPNFSISRAAALLQSRPAYLAAAAIVAVLATAIAIVFGYLSPDSWYYILIAQGLRHGEGCSMHGQYLGVYPCGYPAVLALTAPAANLAALMVSSKISNLLLLSGSFLMVWRASRNILMATVVALNPLTLLIFMYTWSENLELFCICGTFYALARLHAHDQRDWRDHALLALVLVVGVFCRYFFGPFAFFMFVSAWLAYGRKTALKALPAFVVAAFAYAAYQGFNWHMTGYPTGMPRVPAPESPYLILKLFFGAFTANTTSLLIALALLLGLSFRVITLTRHQDAPPRHAAAMFALYSGIAFLALAFVLRAKTLFDPYDTRTIGFGLVLIAAGLVGRFVRLKDDAKWPAWAVLVSGLWAALYADGAAIPDGIDSLRHGHYRFAAAHADQFLYRGPKADTVVTFDIPALDPVYWNVETVKQVYYGRDIVLVSPALGPDLPPDTPQSFLAKLADIGHRTCYFDFTPYSSVDDFRGYLTTTTQIDESFTLGGPPAVTSKPNFDPALQRYLLAIFQPGRMVPCADILNAPVTKAALAGQPIDVAAGDKARQIFLNH